MSVSHSHPSNQLAGTAHFAHAASLWASTGLTLFSNTSLDQTSIYGEGNAVLIGYARVSTSEQNLCVQLNALNAAGCQKIFTDHASDSKVEPLGFAEAVEYARAGDALVVWKLDRLGLSMKGLTDLAAQLSARKIELRSLTDGIDTSGTSGKVVFGIMAAMAEMERDLDRDRTDAVLGLACKGAPAGGRKRAMTARKIDAARQLLGSGTGPREVAAAIGVSLPTLYRHLPASER